VLCIEKYFIDSSFCDVLDGIKGEVQCISVCIKKCNKRVFYLLSLNTDFSLRLVEKIGEVVMDLERLKNDIQLASILSSMHSCAFKS
jgi:hypothetical protein